LTMPTADVTSVKARSCASSPLPLQACEIQNLDLIARQLAAIGVFLRIDLAETRHFAPNGLGQGERPVILRHKQRKSRPFQGKATESDLSRGRRRAVRHLIAAQETAWPRLPLNISFLSEWQGERVVATTTGTRAAPATVSATGTSTPCDWRPLQPPARAKRPSPRILQRAGTRSLRCLFQTRQTSHAQ